MELIHLLMVDDETVFLDTLVNRLKRRGITPLTAQSGEEALPLLSHQPFDVVVLDVKMPGMDGLEVLSYIKQHFPYTEVILLTGHGSTSDGVAGIKAGAFDYLTKPVEFDHLLEKIKQAWDKRKRVEEKQKEAELREKMSRQLAAAEHLASLGTLAAGVAHEINNPLAIIQEWSGWMKCVLDDAGPDLSCREELNMAITKIETAIGRAKRITRQMLEMVQKKSDTVEELSVEDVCSDAVQIVSKEAANKGVRIARLPPEGSFSFRSDPYRLRQILLNLLNNAIQATPAGGVIILKTSVEEPEILFEVQDTGVGIPHENLDKIFEPFFTTKPTGEGTGLGLFVSRKLVDNLGGRIEVDSQPGSGTRFIVRLPLTHNLKEKSTAQS